MAGLRFVAIAALLHCFGGLAPATGSLLRGDGAAKPAYLHLKAATKAKERAVHGKSQHQKRGGKRHKVKQVKRKLGPLQKATAEELSASDALMKASIAHVAKVQNATVSKALAGQNRSTPAPKRLDMGSSLPRTLRLPPGPSPMLRRTHVVAIPDQKDAVQSIVEATDLANAAINAFSDAVEAHVAMVTTTAYNVLPTILPEMRRIKFNTTGKSPRPLELETMRRRLGELANFTRGNSTELVSDFSRQVTAMQHNVTETVNRALTYTMRLAELDLTASIMDEVELGLVPVADMSVNRVMRRIQAAEKSVQVFLDMMNTTEEACYRLLDDYVRARVFHQLQSMGQNCKQNGQAMSHPSVAAGCEKLVTRRTEVGNSLTKTQKRLEDAFAHAAAMETTVYDSLDALRRVVGAWPGQH